MAWVLNSVVVIINFSASPLNITEKKLCTIMKLPSLVFKYGLGPELCTIEFINSSAIPLNITEKNCDQ